MISRSSNREIWKIWGKLDPGNRTEEMKLQGLMAVKGNEQAADGADSEARRSTNTLMWLLFHSYVFFNDTKSQSPGLRLRPAWWTTSQRSQVLLLSIWRQTCVIYSLRRSTCVSKRLRREETWLEYVGANVMAKHLRAKSRKCFSFIFPCKDVSPAWFCQRNSKLLFQLCRRG